MARRRSPLVVVFGLAACGGSSTGDGSSLGSSGASDPDGGVAADTADGPQDTGTDTADTSSGGEPLPPGIPCGTPFTHEGREGCETVVEGIDVKFFPPPPGERVDRLAVYFHGDGAADYLENWAFSADIMDWTAARNTMVVGVLSPAYYEDGTVAFGAAQPEHAAAVAVALEAFVAAYEPEFADGTLYWSTSGGSWFFASSYIAHVGHRLPGVFVPSCGGSGFSFGWAWDPMTEAATRDKMPLYFNYGTADFLAPGIIDSIAEYQGLGFAVDSLVHEGAEHCNHPISAPTIEFWSRHVD